MASPNDVTINGQSVNNPVKVGSAAELVPKAVTILLVAATFLTLAMLLWGGIQYITSAGDMEKAAKAKATLTYAVIGLVISGLSFAIWFVIGQVVGFKLM